MTNLDLLLEELIIERNRFEKEVIRLKKEVVLLRLKIKELQNDKRINLSVSNEH